MKYHLVSAFSDSCAREDKLIIIEIIKNNKNSDYFNPERANKNCSRWYSKLFYYFSEKIRLGISCGSSARQMIHMKC